jgi:hypothetical protein
MMQQLNSCYCQQFNRKHERVGHVLQGRFRALVVDRDDYFRRVLRYIVLNPVRAGLVAHPADWPWSSYRATAGLVAAERVLTLGPVWSAFAPTQAEALQGYAAFVAASRGDRDDAPRGRVVWGSETFVASVSAMLVPYRDQPAIVYSERLAGRPSLDCLFGTSCDSRTLDRRMHNAFNRHGYSLTEIGTFVGRPPATIWRRIRRATLAANCHGNAKIEI